MQRAAPDRSRPRTGQYRLSYVVTDKAEHAIEGGYVFVVRGEGFDGNDFRFNDVELVPDKREYAPGEKVRLQVNTNRAGLDGAAVRAAGERRLPAAAGVAARGQEHGGRNRRRAEGHAELLRRSGDDRRRPGAYRDARDRRAAGEARAERRGHAVGARRTSRAKRRRSR